MTPSERALVFEFLDEVVKHAAKIGGRDCASYPDSVLQRLAIGADRYGDDAFRDRDNIPQLLEETPDIAAYSVLEHVKNLAQTVEQDPLVAHCLFMASVHGALADWFARAARRGGE